MAGRSPTGQPLALLDLSWYYAASSFCPSLLQDNLLWSREPNFPPVVLQIVQATSKLVIKATFLF